MIGISIIICCYNSSKRIEETLKHIEIQKVKEDNWELIIVDNNCSDNTVQVVKDFLLPRENLKNRTRIFSEPNPGKSYAMLKGINQSKYDLLVFCDDDNWLNSMFLQNSQNFLLKNPEYGIVGGNGEPECEIQPPLWFDKLKGVYATGCRNDGDVTNVYGAGMVVVKKLITDFNFSLTCRKGDSLSSGGDSEMCFWVAKKGFKIRQLCENTFKHFIPKERLTDDYILRMAKAYGETSAQLYKLEHENPYKGVFYRFKTDLIFLSKKLFDFDFFNFKYEGIKKYYYWKTRFL